jgi:hypothetical protein
VEKRSLDADRWGVPEIPLLKPEERRTVEVVTSSVDVDVRAEDGSVMAFPDLFADTEVRVRILGEAYAEGQTIEVESPAVAVAVTARTE